MRTLRASTGAFQMQKTSNGIRLQRTGELVLLFHLLDSPTTREADLFLPLFIALQDLFWCVLVLLAMLLWPKK